MTSWAYLARRDGQQGIYIYTGKLQQADQQQQCQSLVGQDCLAATIQLQLTDQQLQCQSLVDQDYLATIQLQLTKRFPYQDVNFIKTLK